MSTGIATGIALFMYAAAVTPFAWMGVRPKSARWLAIPSGAMILVVAWGQSGLLSRGSLASIDVTHLVQTVTPQSRCVEIFDLLIENGVVLERPSPEGLVVRGAMWDQMPPPVREAVVACAQPQASDNAAREVPLIRR